MFTTYLALKIGTVSVIDYFSTVLVDFVIERSHDNVVDTVTRLGLHDRIPARARDFLFAKTSRPGLRTHPASFSVGTRVLCQE